TPDNVGEAVRRVRPYGVDVNSGVEARPGRKDETRVLRFVNEARMAAAP
ncbi:MAG TPA: N-(5'-phosphoribosyl)anthranilate isomerase, partial [Methylomirabilota bacterium]|nr:N-(5'-phosphoribosyl)anthranilate isomerase [Methylomirabilota bacterium]